MTPGPTVEVMKLTPAVIELVVADMAASLAFYRLLGLDIPAEADAERHVEVPLGGLRWPGTSRRPRGR